MTMQDQMRKAFGHYASRQIARAHVGEKALVRPKLNPLLMKQGDDLESPLYVTPDSSAMDYDGNTLPDEKSYRRLAKRARGYEAGNRTDDYVQPPKADEYVQPPKDMSFTDALIGRDDNKAYVDDHMRSLVNADDTIFVSPEAAKEMGSVFVDDFGNHGKVVTKDQVGKQARDYTAGNLTDDYIKPPKYDDYVQSPTYNDYVQPPTDIFDASQFEMANDEATNSIDDVSMGIDEGQFDMTPTKGLQQ